MNIGDPVSVELSHLLHQQGPRARVATYHMRELTRGKFLVKSEDITLLECIGEGIAELTLKSVSSCRDVLVSFRRSWNCLQGQIRTNQKSSS